MAHTDWLNTGLEKLILLAFKKVVLPAPENIVQVKF